MANSNDVIPVAVANLVSYIEDDDAFVDGVVAYGPIGEVDREMVYIGDSVDEDTVNWATIGPTSAQARQQMASTFSVTVAVGGKGNTAQESFERACELRGAVEDIVRANSKLGLPQTLAPIIRVSAMRHAFLPEDEGVGCAAGLVIRIEARL